MSDEGVPQELPPQGVKRSTRDAGDLRGALQAWLTHRLGAVADPEVSEITSPSATGLSSETLLFDATWREDGSRYALHLHFTRFETTGFQQKIVTARVEHPDGSEELIADIDAHLRFDARNRRLLGGRLECTMADGWPRPLGIEVLGDTGVHLGAGLYFGFDGHHHGEWRGDFHLEGERIADCTPPEQARRLHQIRDTAIRVRDEKEGATGWGNCQPIAAGPWPDLGLDDDAWI